MIVRVLLACVLVAAGCASARPQPSPEVAPLPTSPPAEPAALPAAPPAAPPTDPAAPPSEPPTGAPTDPAAPPSEPPVEPPPEVDPLAAVRAACAPATWAQCQPTLDAMRARLTTAEALVIVKDLDQRAAVWSAPVARTIGVLLPLTGPHDKAGLAAKQAIELAAGGSVHLEFVDTAEDPATATAAAERLLAERHVAALLGPIGRKETAAVAAVARRFGVPHIPLATAIAPANEPGWDPVVRVRTSTAELAEAVARHARSELGIDRFAILHPTSDLGAEAAAAFAAEVARLGGTVVVTASYAPTDGKQVADFKAGLQALVRASKPGKDATVDFDALFVPDQAAVVRRLAPALAAWGVAPRTAPLPLASEDAGKGKGKGKKKPAPRRVQLLGLSAWASPALIEKGTGITDNAIFADVWVPEQAAQDFVAAMSGAGKKPTAFDAEVWDATRFLVGAVLPVTAGLPAERGEDVRLAVGAALATPHTEAGATGAVTIVDGGKLLSRAHLMTVDREALRPRLSEAEERALRAGRPALAPPGAPAASPDP